MASVLLLLSGSLFAAAELEDGTVPSSDGAAAGARMARGQAPSRSGARTPVATVTDTPTLRAEPDRDSATRPGPGTATEPSTEPAPRTHAPKPAAEGEPVEPLRSLTDDPLSAAASVAPTPRLQTSTPTPDPTSSASPEPTTEPTTEPTDPSESPSADDSEPPEDETAPQTSIDSGPSSDESEEDSPAEDAGDEVRRRLPSLPGPAQPGESEESDGSDEAEFTFHANEDASFTCSLDGAGFRLCESPASYDDLEDGWHTFEVRARDEAGNVDSSPAHWRWYVD